VQLQQRTATGENVRYRFRPEKRASGGPTVSSSEDSALTLRFLGQEIGQIGVGRRLLRHTRVSDENPGVDFMA